MTRADLEAVRDRQIPATGRLCIALASTLLSVLDACDAASAANDAGPSWNLPWMTKGRVVASVVLESDLP